VSDSADILAGKALNPDFGTGYFVRAWAMRRLAADRLEVLMEDSAHALAIVLTHDAATVTDVAARWERAPISSCGGAADFLGTLAGAPLSDDVQALGLVADATSHCTHMFDTCRLGIVHIARGRPDRRYDVIVPDVVEGPQPVELRVDGETVLKLLVARDMTVLGPDWLAGAPLLRGFARWAEGRLDAGTFERLVMMQRTLFVSRGRRIDMAHYYGAPAKMLGPPEGSCFGSEPERFRGAVRNASGRPEITVEGALGFGG
jgi:hypothetical protein